MTQYIQVVTTVDDKAIAEKIAEILLQKRLVACAQIMPCLSKYHWQGTIEKSEEFLCIMKTRLELYPLVEQAIKENHPYEIPEILAVDVVSGEKKYLEWMDSELYINNDE